MLLPGSVWSAVSSYSASGESSLSVSLLLSSHPAFLPLILLPALSGMPVVVLAAAPVAAPLLSCCSLVFSRSRVVSWGQVLCRSVGRCAGRSLFRSSVSEVLSWSVVYGRHSRNMRSHGCHDCQCLLLALALVLVSAAGAAASGAVWQLCWVCSTCSTVIAALLLAGGAVVCTVASVKFELLAARGVGSLSAVGVSRVSAIVILSSPPSSSSLLLLSAVGPLFE